MLAGNRLRELPASLAQCHKLELLRIAANQLSELPHWLLNMPRLAWLAFAGNPLCAKDEAQVLAEHPLAGIDWSQLTGGQLLGEGASGVIRQALWQTADGNTRPVAVKLFKGAVTSDGLPGCEMNACIAAGRHANLIGLLGTLDGHPQATPGLVLELIEASFGTLANPPSLESCTRDIYPADCRFSLTEVLGIAGGIASACAHLHEQGINHGDLYGHNILHNSTGDCLLGDFGAASMYGRQRAEITTAIEQIEVRAFACLLEELLEHCDLADKQCAKLMHLWAIQGACSLTEPHRRPRFKDVLAALNPQRLTCVKPKLAMSQSDWRYHSG
jgi:serine/threonine protein kinase